MTGLAPRSELLIGGHWLDAADGMTFPDFNPATGEPLGHVARATPADVNSAIAAASEAFPGWAATPPTERAALLGRTASLIRTHAPALARVECLDTGRPIAEIDPGDLDAVADIIDYFAGVCRQINGNSWTLPNEVAYTRREPLGVCAGIGPWNFPLYVTAYKLAPALACGNTMVYKPSELTPLSISMLADLFARAGLPPGVLNIVHGGAAVGALLTSDPRVRKVSMTGSTATGRRVLHDAADSIKRVTLELGGKSPMLVFEDADMDRAALIAVRSNFYAQGEGCTHTTRVFVPRSHRDEFVHRVLRHVEALVVGDPLDRNTSIGSLISAQHLQRVHSYVETARREGARVLCGGERVVGGAMARGQFYAPTVIDSCHDQMTHVREEIFGPVMSILEFDDEAEVVARANETEYGLAASVFTRDVGRAHRVAHALQAGICWINTYGNTPVEIPFGGVKQSGLGREGHAAIDHYSELKTVYVSL